MTTQTQVRYMHIVLNILSYFNTDTHQAFKLFPDIVNKHDKYSG